MNYTTKYALDLSNGRPFVFEIPEDQCANFEDRTKLLEFSLFPAYEDVQKIVEEDGYAELLVLKILMGFGLTGVCANRLIENDQFVARVRVCFDGVTQDAERALWTLSVVYMTAKRQLSANTLFS